MPVIDLAGLREALNADPEFRLASRFWNGRLLLSMGDGRALLDIRAGEVVRATDQVTMFDAWDVELAGPADGWAKLLAPEPPPFYQCVFPAVLHHGFRMGGDLEMLFAYYPAVRRLIDLARGGFVTA